MKEIFSELAPLPGALPASFSRMNLLLFICPRQWKYRYELKLKGATPPSDPAMEAGKAMHSVLECAVNTSRLCGFAPGMTGYTQLMERRMLLESEPVRRLLSEMQGSAKKVLDAVIRTARKHGAKAFTERRLMLTRGGEVASPREKYANAGWVGFVDLELLGEKKMIILDYKSEHFSEEREESVAVQTEMYMYAEFLRYAELAEIQAGCGYLKDGSIVLGESVPRSALPAMEERLRGLYSRYLEAVLSRSREKRPSKYCAWCEYRGMCSSDPSC